MRRSVVLIVFAFVAAACANNGGEAVGSADDVPSSSAAAQPQPLSIEVDDAEIGPVLVDGDGRSLYVYLLDDATSTACDDACRTTWTPVLVAGKLTLADELDRSLFGRRALGDGEKQLTIDGQPVYRYVDDVEPGDQLGQGTDTLWFMVKPSGLRNTGIPPSA